MFVLGCFLKKLPTQIRFWWLVESFFFGVSQTCKDWPFSSGGSKKVLGLCGNTGQPLRE